MSYCSQATDVYTPTFEQCVTGEVYVCNAVPGDVTAPGITFAA